MTMTGEAPTMPRQRPGHRQQQVVYVIDPLAQQHSAHQWPTEAARPSRPTRVGWLWGAVYLAGMAAAALTGSTIVLLFWAGGLISGWTRLVALAGVVPMAGILWVATLVLLSRLSRHYLN